MSPNTAKLVEESNRMVDLVQELRDERYRLSVKLSDCYVDGIGYPDTDEYRALKSAWDSAVDRYLAAYIKSTDCHKKAGIALMEEAGLRDPRCSQTAVAFGTR